MCNAKPTSPSTFNVFGKEIALKKQTSRQKKCRRRIILSSSLTVLAMVLIGAVVGTLEHKSNSGSDSVPASSMTPSATFKAVCSAAQDPDSCFSSLESSKTTDLESLFKLSLEMAAAELSKLSDFPQNLIDNSTDKHVKEALTLCTDLFDVALYQLNESISSMDVKYETEKTKIDDINTWLNTTLTDQETCLDGLRDLNYTLIEDLELLIKYGTNRLAIVAKILGLLSELGMPAHRKLLGMGSDFPDWVSVSDRRLLQETTPTPTVTVAKDGSGDFKTIKEAAALAPKKKLTRFVIYVKEGVYEENINLEKHVWNVMIYGDGKGKTIVSGSLNLIDGTPAFSAATFAAVGKGFIAKDISFKNTAGASKHQAVAFRSV